MVLKCPILANVHTIDNDNAGGLVVKKSHNLVNVVCERPLIILEPHSQSTLYINTLLTLRW